MPLKPYSFRYPYDVQTTLEPWRNQLSGNILVGPNTYDDVIAHLRDRDRAIEDYLSLGVAQGYLGIGFAPSSQAITTVDTDVTGCTVTFTVPDGNRLIKVTSFVFVEAVTSPANTFVVTNMQEDNIVIDSEYLCHGAPGTAAGPQMHQLQKFYTPKKGPHTVKISIHSVINTGLS